MHEDFSKDFAQFKVKIDNFVVSTHFNSKLTQYENMLHEITAISLDDMKEDIKNSQDFIQTLEQSRDLMAKIVSLNKELDTIFKMDEKDLGEFSDHNLSMVEISIGKSLNEAADLLYQFDIVSAKGRKIIEVLEDPFIHQGM